MIAMSELITELVSSNDPILREKTPTWDWADPPMDAIELAHRLAQTCLEHDALGLSGPQIGLPYRACIVKANPMICMFNPKIVDVSLGEEYGDEGCLSYPNLVISIKRASVIRLRYARPNGDVVTERYEGMTARIMQHEIDHLDGITFQKRATHYHLEKAKKAMRKTSR